MIDLLYWRATSEPPKKDPRTSWHCQFHPLRVAIILHPILHPIADPQVPRFRWAAAPHGPSQIVGRLSASARRPSLAAFVGAAAWPGFGGGACYRALQAQRAYGSWAEIFFWGVIGDGVKIPASFCVMLGIVSIHLSILKYRNSKGSSYHYHYLVPKAKP